jgi:hypothetical protein
LKDIFKGNSRTSQYMGSFYRGLSNQILKMMNTLKIEDMLEGVTNFQEWKESILLLLEENDLKEYFEGVVASPIDS